MFKVPKYRLFADPREIPKGYLQSLGAKEISDHDFRIALNEAHWLMSLAIDQETAARMRRQSRVGVVGATSRAELKARQLCEQRRDEILWLLAGLLGMHLPAENAAARAKAEELCALANKRSQDADREARLKLKRQIGQGGFRVPFSIRNAPKRR